MKTRFAVLPDERRVILGIDKANIFQAGMVYEAIEILDEIVIRKIGKYHLAKSHDYPSEQSEAGEIMQSGYHLITEEEYKNLIEYENSLHYENNKPE